MKHLIYLAIIPLSLVVSGCDKLGVPRSTEAFQFVTTPSGDSFIFHPKTGKISRITKDGLEPLGEATIVLRVDGYYKLEDSGDQPFVKYVGAGKFEPSKYAIRKTSD